MNKRTLVEAIAERTGSSANGAEAALDAVLDSITTALVAGDKVTLPGFGTFEVRTRSARRGRNIRTGEPIEIPAGRTAAFRPAAALKREIAEG